MAVSLILLQALVALVGFLVYRQFIQRGASRNGLRLPPGPKPLPIIGNLLDLPPAGSPEFQHWLKHKDAYGPISSVTIFGQTIVLIHGKEAALHLLEKKSMASSGRPQLKFASEMCGFNNIITLRSFDERCRRQRRFFHQYIGTKTLAMQLGDVQELESQRLLVRALKEPHNMLQHLKTEASAVMLKMAYSYTVEPHKTDPLVAIVELLMKKLSSAVVPMSWIVDAIPFLERLPEILPGMGFKGTARQIRKLGQVTISTPLDFVQRQMTGSTAYRPSFSSHLIQQLGRHDDDGSSAELKLSDQDEEDIKWAAGAMYLGGSDTTVWSLYSFMLAMVMFPDVQRKAQEEIDRVVGHDRLPGLEDRAKLPYMEALITETFRWYPITPMGFVHQLEEDVVYKDYLIPKGALLLPAVWWLTHDPQEHPEPDAFVPERFLQPRNEAEPFPHVFGYGRRKCPGRYVAESSVFISATQLLATFRFSKAVDDQGKEIEVQVGHGSGGIDHPSEFQYKMEPRSEEHAALIRDFELLAWQESDAGLLGDREQLAEFVVQG